jgi:hypothetical protein
MVEWLFCMLLQGVGQAVVRYYSFSDVCRRAKMVVVLFAYRGAV